MIPANTECFFRAQCPEVVNCAHQGVDHSVPFSCGLARYFDLERRIDAIVGQIEFNRPAINAAWNRVPFGGRIGH
jgi:hypothetical protein